jgi:hypothetical protein
MFMLWNGKPSQPCYVDDYAADGALYVSDALPRMGVRMYQNGVSVHGTRRTWDALLSHNIARAYRPEGVPW